MATCTATEVITEKTTKPEEARSTAEVKATLDEGVTFNNATFGQHWTGQKTTTKDNDTSSVNSNSTPSTTSDDSYYSDNCMRQFQVGFKSRLTQYSSQIKTFAVLSCLAAYTVYLIFAINFDFELAKVLVVITSIVAFLVLYKYLRDYYGEAVYEKVLLPFSHLIGQHWHVLKWIAYPLGVAVLVLYLVLYVISTVQQVQSIFGIAVFISISYLTSKHPDKVKWRTVLCGYGMLVVLGILFLSLRAGYNILQFVADAITKFIYFAFEGAAVAYGDPWLMFHPFTMMALSVIMYMGAVMAILYYYGIVQICSTKIAWFMQIAMKTTAVETLGVVSNSFLNGVDTMLMLRGYLDKLTPSEFHTFVVGEHATVAGFMFGVFIFFGAPSQHLLAAAMMSTPAVIAVTKLNWPENEQSCTENVDDVILEKGDEISVFEACKSGANDAGKAVTSILLNYIAILSLLAWLNATIAWLTGRVGYPNIGYEEIFSYLFWPVALLIGVEVQECREVAKLIGVKVFTTEILAYQELGRSARSGVLSERSAALATYAIFGFSSLSTIAIAVGVWKSICPAKMKQMASHLLRTSINANLACFTVACIAGLMFRDDLMIVAEKEETPLRDFIASMPGYKEMMALLPDSITQ